MPAKSCSAATSSSRPAPLLIFIHGQFGHADVYLKDGKWYDRMGFRDCARENGYIALLPQGLNDHIEGTDVSNGMPTNNGGADQGTGWNVGSGGDERVCLTDSSLETLGVADKGARDAMATQYSCYQSCAKLGKCGKCNWSTCHDDVAFIKAMITRASKDYCIDLSRIYLTGESNGGMMTHRLSQEMPNTFAAVAPIYALPFLGYLHGDRGQMMRNGVSLRETAFLTFHDRQDTLIPMGGGWAAGWVYTTLESVVQTWAGIHGCRDRSTPVELAFEHESAFDCDEFLECSSKKRVVRCLYNGWHGKTPEAQAGGNEAFWFFNQFRRSAKVSWD